MKNIILENNNGYKWCSSENVHIKSSVTSDNLIQRFREVNTVKDFIEELEQINCFFSIIIETENYIFIATDRVRSMPLFYSNFNNEFIVSDKATNIEYTNTDFDVNAVDEYLNCGYVTGSSTLINHIKQVQAGELVVYDKINKHIETKRYFEFKHQSFFQDNESELIAKMSIMYENVFKNMIKNLNGKTAIIPLSGGYDSRLIVYMLNKLNYQNVICFTYGERGNWESNISEKVARYYGYKWIFIEYTKENLYNIYQDEIDQYIEFSTNLSTPAHTQDLLAVKKLKEQNLIPSDSIFIPGHSGDMVAGSHIPSNLLELKELDINYLSKSILNKHYTLQKINHSNKLNNFFEEKIKTILHYKESYTHEEIANELEFWNWQERQSKYICNSVKVYEFYGYQWLMPLWDNDVMSFWSKIPVNFRINRKLYFEFVKKTHTTNIPINPKINYFIGKYESLFNIWYARFIGRKPFIVIFFTKLQDIIKNIDIDYIDNNKIIYLFSKVGLNVLKSFSVIKNLKKKLNEL